MSIVDWCSIVVHGYGGWDSDNTDIEGVIVGVPEVICFVVVGRNDISDVAVGTEIEIAFFAILLGSCPFYMLVLHL